MNDDKFRRTNKAQTEVVSTPLCQSQELNQRVGELCKETGRELRDFHISCEEVLTELGIDQEETKALE